MDFVKRLLFVLLVTAVLVFFSEKMYWYPQGYALGALLLFYAVPVYACLWAIDALRVQSGAGMVLVASLYAFLVEGVLTPVLYEGGLLDPVLPAYFVAWHGLLAFLFGWYWVRKWLLAGQWRRLLAGSVLVGLLWGSWAITYWLPETFSDFALHAFTFTTMFVVAHALLGRGGWLVSFQPSRVEKWVVLALLLFFFATLAFPAAPLGIVKLGVLCTAVFLPLTLQKRTAVPGSILQTMAGPIQSRYLLILFLMPGVGTAVYALAASLPVSEDSLRLILELMPLAQGLVGAACFLWAIISVLSKAKRQSKAKTADSFG
ncbi:MAG: hypothetical protein H6653_07585 [Ardenticatenaceae bacterium]|nr:hypothetical protein [Ardenticatenaceae bacterium]